MLRLRTTFSPLRFYEQARVAAMRAFDANDGDWFVVDSKWVVHVIVEAK